MTPLERKSQPREGNGDWKPSTPIPDGVRHFSAPGTHIFDIEARPEFHPDVVGKTGYEPLEPMRAIFREYIHAKTGIDTHHLQYDPTAAITEAVTNAMVHAHNYDGRPVRVILQVRHPVSTVQSQPKLLTIKVWDCGEEGFPKNILERVKRQERTIERIDRETDQINEKVRQHEEALKQHEEEMKRLNGSDRKTLLKMEGIRKRMAQREKWLEGLRMKELENLAERAGTFGVTGKGNTAAGTGMGLYIIRQMTRQKHYGQKWGHLEFNSLEPPHWPFRNEIVIKIPLIQAQTMKRQGPEQSA